MTRRLEDALVQAILLLLDNQRHRPTLERHNKVRSELREAWVEGRRSRP